VVSSLCEPCPQFAVNGFQSLQFLEGSTGDMDELSQSESY